MRYFASFFILILILIAPYWMYLPALIIAVLVFPFYLEAIPLALLIDILYGRHGSVLSSFPFGMIAALIVLAAAPIREHLRFNA